MFSGWYWGFSFCHYLQTGSVTYLTFFSDKYCGLLLPHFIVHVVGTCESCGFQGSIRVIVF